MAGESHRDEALSLLAAANNHGDLNVKLSSLNKLKDVLLSMEPSSAAEVFPYLAELQSSPEHLVRKLLVEVIEDVGLKSIEHSAILMSVLLTLLRDGDTVVASQSIVSGTIFFLTVLEKMTIQFHQRGKVERWLEEIWIWMVRFKDVVFDIALQLGSVGTKILAFKFLETFVLIFTPDSKEYEKADGAARTRGAFNISWLISGHPVLDPGSLMSEANRTLGVLLNLLRSSGSLPGPLTICIVNCLAAIARKRPQYYDTVISTLFDFDPNSQTATGCHAASIQYSLRTAFLGFLRCTYSPILESRDQLLRSLRSMNAGDAADQVIRQVDKMIKNNERALRETRVIKDDQQSSQPPILGDLVRKRSVPVDSELVSNGHEPVTKRICTGPDPNLSNDSGKDAMSINGVHPNIPLLDGELTAVEQMIAMIGALLAEGERGAESLQILISKIHPDLLADIVITNMRHLPKVPPPLTRFGNSPVAQQTGPLTCQGQVSAAPVPTRPTQSSAISSEVSAISNSLPMPDSGDILASDPKRDPRRDPRRLDPRRVGVTVGVPSVPAMEDSSALQTEFDSYILSKPMSCPVVTINENPPSAFPSKIISEDKVSEKSPISTDISTPRDELPDGPGKVEATLESNNSSEQILSSVDVLDEDQKLSDTTGISAVDTLSNMEPDDSCPDISSASEDVCTELPVLPSYIELSQEQEIIVKTAAVEHIIESFNHISGTDCQQMCMSLLARLIAQIDDQDLFINMLQRHVLHDQWRKGHELVLHILYHLHSLVILGSDENSSSADVLYEKFLLAVANSLLDSFPASDKSFSRLLGEVPFLPDSALKLLSDICYLDVIDHLGKIVRDVERVTQGLGAVWSLILGRPQNRKNCLAIALKCAAHPQDEIRAKAIRLVANKLYLLSFISEDIEQCAINMLLSAVDQQVSETGPSQSGSSEPRAEGEVENQETSISDSQMSESANSENDSLKVSNVANQIQPSMSFAEAQRLVSLYFALCTKKPSLLEMVFNTYGSAPRAVKQAFHRHIPIVMRALGQSYSDLLHIISDPPQGSENLLSLVLQILTQETTPSSELIATVKHLYETKLKDVSILVPMLSSLSKSEVLPIFPRLVNLPSEKFQMALAHILQGSAHTGPALTPVEVLVAIHSVSPEKDGLPLKKIMDACSACFEQRTVFTQQVLAKALNQMVDQTPLPLLFMRTVIQAIDAFPTLVDFLMEILSKLVSKQVWRMPKLWVGFLKCVSQTQPRSFHVLLLLPSPQLESALNKHANLRGSLTAYANQPSIKSSLPRSTLEVLGLINETHTQQQHSTSLRSPDTSSSFHGATMMQ